MSIELARSVPGLSPGLTVPPVATIFETLPSPVRVPPRTFTLVLDVKSPSICNVPPATTVWPMYEETPAITTVPSLAAGTVTVPVPPMSPEMVSVPPEGAKSALPIKWIVPLSVGL